MSSIVLNPSGQPASPVEGEVYYDSTADKLKVRDSSAFREVVSKNSSGEIDGTLSSSAVIPASIGGSEVLLESHTFDNTIADKIINFNSFSTTYDQYKIRMVRVQPEYDDRDFRIKISTDGSTYLSSYRGVLNRAYYGGSTATSDGSAFSSYFLHITSVGNADPESAGVSNEGIDIDMIISYPLRSNTRTFIRAYYSHNTAAGNIHAGVAACRVLYSSASHPYFKMYWENADNFKSGEMYLYGIKNA